VQIWLSLQVVPSAFSGFEQRPVAGEQAPTTWHWSCAVQTTGLSPTQIPVWHVSLCVQRLLSLQVVPFGFSGFEQMPVAGLHVPATWHWSDAVHVTGLPPVQTPVWQVEVPVQASLSLHELPFALGGFEHAPVSAPHAPTSWHWSDAEQLMGLAPVHFWLWQVDEPVHGLWSSQLAPLDCPVHWPHGILIFAVRQPEGPM
jgi:hypothetical protein